MNIAFSCFDNFRPIYKPLKRTIFNNKTNSRVKGPDFEPLLYASSGKYNKHMYQKTTYGKFT